MKPFQEMHGKRVSAWRHTVKAHMTGGYVCQIDLDPGKRETLIQQPLKECQNIHNRALKWEDIADTTDITAQMPAIYECIRL